ncbi:MAG: hypothetical protein ACOYMR_13420, partial [Ilumatobacteraceae bacterium]
RSAASGSTAIVVVGGTVVTVVVVVVLEVVLEVLVLAGAEVATGTVDVTGAEVEPLVHAATVSESTMNATAVAPGHLDAEPVRCLDNLTAAVSQNATTPRRHETAGALAVLLVTRDLVSRSCRRRP